MDEHPAIKRQQERVAALHGDRLAAALPLAETLLQAARLVGSSVSADVQVADGRARLSVDPEEGVLLRFDDAATARSDFVGTVGELRESGTAGG